MKNTRLNVYYTKNCVNIAWQIKYKYTEKKTKLTLGSIIISKK